MAEESTTQVTETAEQGLSDVATGTALQTPPAAAGNDSTTPADPAADATKTEANKDAAAPQQNIGSANTEKQKAKAEASNAEDKKEGGDDADKPITDWSKVKIDLPKDTPIDEVAFGDFGKKAVELGLTEKQAKELVNFQLGAIAGQRERFMEAGTKALREAWGGKVEENRQAVLTLIANVDRQLGNDNAFSKALDACGATCFPDVCRGLLHLAQSMSEDSMGRGGASGTAQRAETIEEALQAEWNKARGGRI